MLPVLALLKPVTDSAVALTALLQKLTDELDVRGFSAHTKENYVGAIDRLARHYGRSPDQITDEELKLYPP